MNYNNYEKQVLEKLFSDISWLCSIHVKKDSDLAWMIFQKFEQALGIFLDTRNNKYITLLNGLIPNKRGKEQCDCSKNLGNCGCRVKDYNDCLEEISFSIELAKKLIDQNNEQ